MWDGYIIGTSTIMDRVCYSNPHIRYIPFAIAIFNYRTGGYRV